MKTFESGMRTVANSRRMHLTGRLDLLCVNGSLRKCDASILAHNDHWM